MPGLCGLLNTRLVLQECSTQYDIVSHKSRRRAKGSAKPPNASETPARAPIATAVEPSAAADPDRHPLHRRHLITASWALLVAVVAGIGSVVYQRAKGPESVILLNPDTATRVVVVQDSAQRAVMGSMVRELRALRSGRSRIDPSPVASSVDGAADAAPLTEPQLPEFRLPSNVKGYLTRDIGVFANATCGQSEFAPGVDASISTTLRNPADSSRLTPLTVTILRRTSSTGRIQLFSQQYKLRRRTRVAFPVPRDTGAYDLEFGFFATDELQSATPPFYLRRCLILIR